VGVYLVERYVPSMNGEDLAAAVGRLDRTGSMVRHVWTTLVAEEQTCLSLFEADDLSSVEVANLEAAFPFDRVVEATIVLAATP
jgi:muconolactone delta-isomerase